MTIIYVLAALFAFVAGAIAYSYFPLFEDKDDNSDNHIRSLEAEVSQYKAEVKRIEANLDSILKDKRELLKQYDIAIKDNSKLELANATFRKDLLTATATIERIEQGNLVVQGDAKSRSISSKPTGMKQSGVKGYIYEGELITITNASTRKLKEIREKGTQVTLWY